MTPIEKINFSFLCNENASKMTPCEQGLHCKVCDKTVIDFRNKNLNDLNKLLEKEGSVCGIFSKEQVQLPKHKRWWKPIITSVLIAIGLGSMTEKVVAQNDNIKEAAKKKVNEQHKSENTFFGAICETQAVYKDGGYKGLKKFLDANLKVPDSVQGRVYARFVVDTLGKTSEVEIIRGLDEATNQEAIRVVKLLEFIPATRMGKKTPVRMTIPVFVNPKKKED